jgi:hypothetical protein
MRRLSAGRRLFPCALTSSHIISVADLRTGHWLLPASTYASALARVAAAKPAAGVSVEVTGLPAFVLRALHVGAGVYSLICCSASRAPTLGSHRLPGLGARSLISVSLFRAHCVAPDAPVPPGASGIRPVTLPARRCFSLLPFSLMLTLPVVCSCRPYA